MLGLHFFESLTDFGPCLSCYDEIQPILFGRLVVGGQDFHLVAAVQFLAEWGILFVDFGTDTMVAHIGVDGIGKIQYSGTFGKLEQVPLRGEHENFIFIQIHFELVHELEVVVVLQRAAYVVKPFVHSAFSAFNTFVSPMRGQSSFGYFVHSPGTYLYLYPALFRSQHSDV